MADDDDDPYEERRTRPKYWTEFDCPSCSANNPCDDGFRPGDEVNCAFCGMVWGVRAIDDQRFKLVEV